MKFTITIEDQEDGRVKVESTPHMQKLTALARARDLTPAAAYALGALAKIISDSRKNAQEEVKAKFDAGVIPAIPSQRKMFS